MLRHLVVTAGVIGMLAASAGAAQSAVFVPNDPTAYKPFTMTGVLTLNQLTPVNCTVTLVGLIQPGGTSASITSGVFSGTDWRCGTLVYPSSFPWTVTPSLPPTVTVNGIGAVTVVGNCSGNLVLNWNNAAPNLTLSAHSIPGTPNICTITGTLSSTPNIAIQ